MKDEVNPYMLSLSAATLKALDRFGSGKGLNQSPTDKPDSNPNPRPVRISNAPDPISPLRGSSYIPPKKPQPINWAHWELMSWVELQQAVALSVNVNPDNVTKVDDVLIKRMEIALSHVDAGSLTLEHHYARNQPMSLVALCKFADWAVKLNIPDLPPELVAMAARAPAQTATTPPSLKATETKEQRQDRRLEACIDAGLSFEDYKGRLPDGVGNAADRERVTRQAFSTDVKAALKRRESTKREGATVHHA